MSTPATPTTPGAADVPPAVRQIMEDLAAGKEPNRVHAWITRAATGEVEDLGVSENLRTTDGADWQTEAMGKATGRPAVADWIALTTNSTAPAAGDTTLTGEITTGGLARAQGTYSHTNDTTSYKISYTFTATAAHTAVAKGGLFTASTGGVMVFETLLNATATLAINDTLTIEWTINI